MFPLGDESHAQRSTPLATISLIILSCLGFALELHEGDGFILRWSLIPAHIVAGQDLSTIVSSMFLHGSWSHILGNMIYFWAFAPPLEDQLGSVRLLLFYFLGGAIAMGAQIAGDPSSTVPCLGASGAIAAVMGGFLVTFPRDRIRTVVFLGFYARIAFVPALILIGFWFVLQLISVGSVSGADTQGGVAYLAHIGGFIFGAATIRLFWMGRGKPGD